MAKINKKEATQPTSQATPKNSVKSRITNKGNLKAHIIDIFMTEKGYDKKTEINPKEISVEVALAINDAVKDEVAIITKAVTAAIVSAVIENSGK